MEHTHLIHASDLDRYAPTIDSQSVIPELVYLLVKQSCDDLTVCRIPYGGSINQPGFDGLVETLKGYREYVPKSKSYWEIGTGSNPQEKASRDLKKRTNDLVFEERAGAAFVFVTPRSTGMGGWNEPEQAKWLEGRADSGWKEIRILDGIKLADWLREYPSISMWMAKKMNISARLGGITTPAEHWNEITTLSTGNDPNIPPKLFTIGRDSACTALQALFDGKISVLQFFAESERDVADFVSAYIATKDIEYSAQITNRCLFINDEQAWRSIIETRAPHIIVASPRIGLETEDGAVLLSLARSKGHSVIVPLSGLWSGNNPEIIKLRSPTQSQIESTLTEAGYGEIRAKEIGRIGADRISSLIRHLRGLSTLPPYATWENATLISQAMLLGKWNGSNESDQSVIGTMLGKSYGEWIEILRHDTLRSDSPLLQSNECWKFVSRSEAWDSLGARIFDSDLEKFKVLALCVLGENDPKFELEQERRFAASIYGKSLRYSRLLREGVAETLALLGSRPKSLTSCSFGKVESISTEVVRDLLRTKDWQRWASLDNLMPMLAESSPTGFLDSLESALSVIGDSPFNRIYEEEGNSSIDGWNYMCGLLWALETLAWSPDLLSRVSILLADLASIDPGGKWANRPINSLIDVFLPWHIQTTATFEKRKSAIIAVIHEQPNVGWSLLLSLLPNNHGFTSGNRQPVWRDYIPRDWKPGVINVDYWNQVDTYIDLAISLAKSDPNKLSELVKRLGDLPKSAHELILNHLVSNDILSLPDELKVELWESLDQLARHHHKYRDTNWALPQDAIKRISEVAETIRPTTPKFRYRHLFNGRDFELFGEKGDFKEQQKQLDEIRVSAVQELLRANGIYDVLNFAREVASPHEIGKALASIRQDSVATFLLPEYLETGENAHKQLIAAFVMYRCFNDGYDWVDNFLTLHWPVRQKAKLLTMLPFCESTWQRVEAVLGGENEGDYWNDVFVNQYLLDETESYVINKLLQFRRYGSAVMCIAHATDARNLYNEEIAIRALLGVLDNPSEIQILDSHYVIELISILQRSESPDRDALFRIEWNFLPWLNKFSSGSPVTLEKKLATDPDFFAELIGIVFRSDLQEAIDNDEPDASRTNLAKNAYSLLTEWKLCPGIQDDGGFDPTAFDTWMNEARRLTEKTGHSSIAQIQIGHILAYSPPDPSGLWIHTKVASLLNCRDTGNMRSGFSTQLYNDRGAHFSTKGAEERKLAELYRTNAEALDKYGFTRFATTIRELANQYINEAEREEE